MNKDAVILQLAELIIDITDPKITKWRREQIEVQARAKAKGYIKAQKKEAS